MSNIEKKDNLESKNNKFKDWLNSLKDSILWKNKEKEQIQNETWNASESLKSNVINSALDNLNLNIQKWLDLHDADDNTKAELNEFFKEWKKEFSDNNETHDEKKFVHEYKKIESRPAAVQRWIENSVEKIENEISNWKQEKNPVARSLLRIVNRIMETEK